MASGVVRLALYVLTSLALNDAVGYSWIAVGTLLLGGVRGGGYSNLSIGAIEALVGGRNRTNDGYVEDAELRRGKVIARRDPMARLRKGLRPSPNPTAFWQTITGLLYMGAGLPLTF